MEWPARPAPPVYQPEIVADGVHLAALTGAPEVVISGTACAFALACRLSPQLIGYAMSWLRFDSQMTRDPGAALLVQPTLFAPSEEAAGVHGPFGLRARRHSVQMWLLRNWTALWRLRLLAGAAARRATRRPASP
jgi:hypothetical protein